MAFPTQNSCVIRSFKLIALEESIEHLGSESSRSGRTAPKIESILGRLQRLRSPVEVARRFHFSAMRRPERCRAQVTSVGSDGGRSAQARRSLRRLAQRRRPEYPPKALMGNE